MRLLQTLLVTLLLATPAQADYWLQKSNVGGLNRADATGFSINGKGYMGTGYSGTYQSDWWEYDPATDSWADKLKISGFGRLEPTALPLAGYGYLCMDSGFGNYYSDFYQYNPTSNARAIKASYGGGPTEEATQFPIGANGFVGIGYDRIPSGVLKNDFFTYAMDNDFSVVNVTIDFFSWKAIPNPSSTDLTLYPQESCNEILTITTFDSRGRLLFKIDKKSPKLTIDVRSWAIGEYVVRITNALMIDKTLLVYKP